MADDLFRLWRLAEEPGSGYGFADAEDLRAAWHIVRRVKGRQALRNPHEAPQRATA